MWDWACACMCLCIHILSDRAIKILFDYCSATSLPPSTLKLFPVICKAPKAFKDWCCKNDQFYHYYEDKVMTVPFFHHSFFIFALSPSPLWIMSLPCGRGPVGPRWLVGKSVGLVIERLQIASTIPAEAVGERSSQDLTLCADSYTVSFPPPCYCSGR